MSRAKILESVFGPPMAAPETRAMRRLRIAFIALATSTSIGVLGIGTIAGLAGNAGAGGIVLALGLVTFGVALVFVIRKTRLDDRWILDRGFDPNNGGRGNE